MLVYEASEKYETQKTRNRRKQVQYIYMYLLIY